MSAAPTAKDVSAGYGELILVAMPAIDLLTSLGWSFKNLYAESFGELGSEGRESESLVILTRRLRSALEALNPGLPADAYAQAVEQLATLKREKLVFDWREKQQTKAAVMQTLKIEMSSSRGPGTLDFCRAAYTCHCDERTMAGMLAHHGWLAPFSAHPFLPWALLLGLHGPALASTSGDVANPEHFQCVGKNRFSGATVVPTEAHGDPTGRAYAAILFDPVLGTPLIVYGPRYRLASPLQQSFIRRHECQHANGVLDEVSANCAALVQMRDQGLLAEHEDQIARWHGAEGTIDPQYGGSGTAFWARTLRCAGARKADSDAFLFGAGAGLFPRPGPASAGAE